MGRTSARSCLTVGRTLLLSALVALAAAGCVLVPYPDAGYAGGGYAVAVPPVVVSPGVVVHGGYGGGDHRGGWGRRWHG